jgi:DUF2971 family protein
MATVQVFAMPNTLYRYRSLEAFDREIEAIRDKYVYCGEFSKLNDPMEGLFDISRRLAATPTSKAIKAAIASMTAAVGIGSFCEAHDNELMWAHYANQFRGICIAYNFRRLVHEMSDDVYFTRMHYTERIPILGVSRQDPDYLAKRVLSYKHYRWGYEREWRIFGPKGKATYETHESIRHVYLGHRMENATRKKIEKILLAEKIGVKRMSLNGYSIEF